MLRQGLDSLFLSDDWILNGFDTSWSSFARQRLQQLDSDLAWMFEGLDLQIMMYFDSRALEAWSWMFEGLDLQTLMHFDSRALKLGLECWWLECSKIWRLGGLKTWRLEYLDVAQSGSRAGKLVLELWMLEYSNVWRFEYLIIRCFECRENCVLLCSLFFNNALPLKWMRMPLYIDIW